MQVEVASYRRTETPWAATIGFANKISVTEWDLCEAFCQGVAERFDFMDDLPEPIEFCTTQKEYSPGSILIPENTTCHYKKTTVKCMQKETGCVGRDGGGERNRDERDRDKDRDRQRDRGYTDNQWQLSHVPKDENLGMYLTLSGHWCLN